MNASIRGSRTAVRREMYRISVSNEGGRAPMLVDLLRICSGSDLSSVVRSDLRVLSDSFSPMNCS